MRGKATSPISIPMFSDDETRENKAPETRRISQTIYKIMCWVQPWSSVATSLESKPLMGGKNKPSMP